MFDEALGPSPWTACLRGFRCETFARSMSSDKNTFPLVRDRFERPPPKRENLKRLPFRCTHVGLQHDQQSQNDNESIVGWPNALHRAGILCYHVPAPQQ